ncbi:saccharopine dehydrogenase NADP-binding domain-containing protein [Streptomyces sp.]|uniref:saccharopine dehydrogenase NADP-binding domain-containing protein n=1 Tax=Streptomyces sp. TaxID=1931 RepID=UPI002D2C249F|nr:saccharopine dehydrogenase NADP-binding domain-containing protein [Streptomyces sp.]HZF89912.1 saccharopine dehydrogenase NADP-binding domain-containing protein [Streptomyces sp.]
MSPRRPPLIGIIGGYGAVGRSAASSLAARGRFRLRIGGRDPEAARVCAARIGGFAEAMPVDAGDTGSLARFSLGCRTVLNCAGPAYLLGDRARHAAFAAGADYVDVMDDGRTAEAVPGRTAVLSAGLSPGLSGLLPGLLAQGLRGAEFTGCHVGLGAFTRTGALDYLLSMERGYGTPMAVWRGRVVTGALGIQEHFQVPGVPRPLTAYPFLTGELVGRAQELGLREARWYNAFDGSALLAALNRSRGGHPTARDLAARAEELVRSSTLDAAGRTPYHVLWGRLNGTDQEGDAVSRAVVVRGEDGSRLTGAIAAFATAAVTNGQVLRGVHQASTVLSPQAVVDWLGGVPGVTVHQTTAKDAGDGAEVDEGVL